MWLAFALAFVIYLVWVINIFRKKKYMGQRNIGHNTVAHYRYPWNEFKVATIAFFAFVIAWLILCFTDWGWLAMLGFIGFCCILVVLNWKSRG